MPNCRGRLSSVVLPESHKLNGHIEEELGGEQPVARTPATSRRTEVVPRGSSSSDLTHGLEKLAEV
jgi:hypothetical protein